MHPEGAENENKCDFDRTRESYQGKLLILSVIIVRVSVEVSDFCWSLNLSKGGHFSVFRNHFLRKFLARTKHRP